jgi:hypothetical protein
MSQTNTPILKRKAKPTPRYTPDSGKKPKKQTVESILDTIEMLYTLIKENKLKVKHVPLNDIKLCANEILINRGKLQMNEINECKKILLNSSKNELKKLGVRIIKKNKGTNIKKSPNSILVSNEYLLVLDHVTIGTCIVNACTDNGYEIEMQNFEKFSIFHKDGDKKKLVVKQNKLFLLNVDSSIGFNENRVEVSLNHISINNF